MTVLNIEMPAKSSKIPPLFRQAFRPFFWFGAAFGTLALALWLAQFLGWLSIPVYGYGLWWHGHEMLFGFTGAVIAGFLLTAVQNWTNIPGPRGWPLAGLFGLWAAARLLLLFPVLPAPLISVLDLAFFPAVAYVLGRPIVRVRQWRNLVFLPILVALTAANAMSHAALWLADPRWLARGLHGALFLVVLLITVVGGRVIPFFTARGTETEAIAPLPLLEKLCFVSTAGMVLVAWTDAWFWLSGWPAAILALVAAAGHALRQAGWRPLSTGRVPLLWSLHGAYAFIAPGFLLAAVYALRLVASPSLMVHCFTVGVLSGLMLGMMARVSLGHSGRPLAVGWSMTLAFAAVLLATFLRVLPGMFQYWNHWLSYVASGALWCLGFGLFAARYLPVLWKARADGRMG
ncbi:MAG: NnrS family protein [Gammaproteobacteria bacterium]|nr:NnrS family protein [Gammaproteobacteria bacterium]